MKFLRCAVLASVACWVVALDGCKTPPSDIGSGPCKLVKRDPSDTDPSDGIRSINMTEEDLGGVKNVDFVSFGSTECESYTCVHDRNMPLTGDPKAEVLGYCTDVCTPANTAKCSPSKETPQYDPVSTPARALGCRALALDEQTLSQFCQAEPARCQEIFGTNRSPYFCARDTATGADGGVQ